MSTVILRKRKNGFYLGNQPNMRFSKKRFTIMVFFKKANLIICNKKKNSTTKTLKLPCQELVEKLDFFFGIYGNMSTITVVPFFLLSLLMLIIHVEPNN